MGFLENRGFTSTVATAGKIAPQVAIDSRPSILLVDDSPDNLLVLREYLRKTRFELEEACNGADAVAKVKLRGYDIIIMDLLMPEMDGFEAMRLIRQWEDRHGATRACILIALTAWALKEAEQESYRCGADLHLTKPIRKAHLLDLLNTQWECIAKQRAISSARDS